MSLFFNEIGPDVNYTHGCELFLFRYIHCWADQRTHRLWGVSRLSSLPARLEVVLNPIIPSFLPFSFISLNANHFNFVYIQIINTYCKLTIIHNDFIWPFLCNLLNCCYFFYTQFEYHYGVKKKKGGYESLVCLEICCDNFILVDLVHR